MKRTKVLLTVLALILGIAMLTACQDRAEDITDKPEKKTTSTPAADTPTPDEPSPTKDLKDPFGNNGGDNGNGNNGNDNKGNENNGNGDNSGDNKGNEDNGGGQAGSYVTTDPFGVEIPSGGGVNYEYKVDSAVDDNGDKAKSNPYIWHITYKNDSCEFCIPIWAEKIQGETPVGTEVFPIAPNFTDGTYQFTAYNSQGELGGSRTLTISIKGSTATVYNHEDGITYYCSLYRTRSWK